MKNKQGHIGPYSVELFENWQSFRAEAAKDVLCAMIIADEGYIGAAGLNTHLAIDIADDLISKLKEKEEK